MIKKFVFFSYTPPLKVKGSGLSVLLYNIIYSIKSFEKEIITFCGDVNVGPEEIKKDNARLKVLVCDSWFSKLYNIKGSRFFKDFLLGISFLINLPIIGKQINNKNTVVTVVVGSSAKPLWKYFLLRTIFRKPKYGLYIVDDLELINVKLNNKYENYLVKKLLSKSINKSDYLMTISYGLKDLYLNKYNKSSFVLLPHYSLSNLLEKKATDKIFTFLFTGGLNFLYNESLLKLASVIDEINNQNECKLELKLKIQTYSSISDFNNLGFNSTNVNYSTVINRNELADIYNNCNSFVVPYSFAPEDKQIVETSFPQKVAEIIQYGKPILCFGPYYSSVVQFFRNNNLDYVCDKPDRNLLKETILKMVSAYENFNELPYLKAYNDFLSEKKVNNIFQSIGNSVIYEN